MAIHGLLWILQSLAARRSRMWDRTSGPMAIHRQKGARRMFVQRPTSQASAFDARPRAAAITGPRFQGHDNIACSHGLRGRHISVDCATADGAPMGTHGTCVPLDKTSSLSVSFDGIGVTCRGYGGVGHFFATVSGLPAEAAAVAPVGS